MGIKGIYNEIGPGERIALSKLAVQTYERTGHPLRLAIDISIWLFQIQSGKGGSNPALRTFYYRLLRLISLSIHPLFVFDGPNKPPFKRGQRTGPNVASIPEFLAKQLLKQFGLPFHIAPGEAEAECALLQQEGIVDAVLSEDVDTLMFGSGLTLRNWSPEGSLKTKTFTHVNSYDAEKTKAGKCGLDQQGMILVALMSGGDYIPEGIPGCGPKTACDAARAGFGKDLCKLGRNDLEGITLWKERLIHELRTNESKFFRSKHKALVIPSDFPRRDVLRYYTHPCISSKNKVESLRQSLKWDQDIDIPGLRLFVSEAFEWECISGAKKFVRNLAPALLVKELRLRGAEDAQASDDTYEIAVREAQLIKTIHLKRQHISTDNMTELRVGFIPISLVPIDLDAEEPDPETPSDESDMEEDEEASPEANGDAGDAPSSPKKKKAPSAYDPTCLEKVWIFETFIKVGVPLKMQDWEESFRNAKKHQTMKTLTKRAENMHNGKGKGGMPSGALDRFTKVTKPGVSMPASMKQIPPSVDIFASSQAVIPPTRTPPERPAPPEDPMTQSSGRPVFRMPLVSPEETTLVVETLPSSQPVLPPARTPPEQPARSELTTTQAHDRPVFRMPPQIASSIRTPQVITIDLLSSPEATVVTKKRTLQRSQSDASSFAKAQPLRDLPSAASLPVLVGIPQTTEVESDIVPELPPSVTTRRHRSPLRRANTLSNPVALAKPIETLPLLALAPETRINTPLIQPPSTPQKAKKQAPIPSSIIEITSSPPQTPKSKQKAITKWLSPRAEKAPPMMLDELGDRNTLSPLSQASKIDRPVFRIPLGTTQASSSTTIVESSISFIHHDGDEISSTARDTTTVSGPHSAEKDDSYTENRREVIRLRESLDGAWRAELAVPEPVSPGKKRKRGDRVKEWRVSQVEVLDLSAL